MNDLKIFQNDSFGEVRVTIVDQEPYFCLADVCKVLELQTSRVKDRLDDDLTLSNPIVDSLGRTQQATFVNESGLYEVILRSDKPEAKSFRKWLTTEVLPSIRKTGKYEAKKLTDMEMLAQGILAAQRVIEDQKHMIEQKQFQIDQQTAQLEEQAPKVAFAEAIVGSTNSILIGAMAKILTQNGFKIGQNQLFALLREDGYLGKVGERYNIPNQEYIDRGIFELKENSHSENGVMKITITPKITGKGQQYFVNKFIGNKSLTIKQ